MEDIRSVIAANITALRTSSGMTQLDLAEKLHYSDKAVSKWERGESVPEIGTLTAIADLFGVPLDYLVRSEHEEPAAAVEQQPAAPVPDHKKEEPRAHRRHERFARVVRGGANLRFYRYNIQKR